jgi:spore coat protein H
MKIDLNDHVPGRRIGGATKLNLHTCVTDPSWMNEVLSHKLFRDAGVPAARTAFARVLLSVPGQYDRHYVGLYSIVENVDNRFAMDRFGTRKGALFKPVTRQLFEDIGDDWSAYRQRYDPKTPVSDEETRQVIEFGRLVSHASDGEFAARVGEFLDLEAFARFMAVTTWLSTMDSILGVGQNFYVYLHPKTRQFQFIPWDLDHSFGQFGMVGTQQQRENLSIHKPWDGSIPFLDRVFKVESFKHRYLAVMRHYNQTIFQPERIHRQVDELASILRPAIQDESAEMAARFDQVTSGQPPPPSASQSFGPPGGFGQTVLPVKPFVVARARSVAAQLDGTSEGMQATRGGFFGGPGGPGGRDNNGPGVPGGPGELGGFGPGTFLGPLLLGALDADKSGHATRLECQTVFQSWFETWNTDNESNLTEAELRAGIDMELAPAPGGSSGFGPPPGGWGPPP